MEQPAAQKSTTTQTEATPFASEPSRPTETEPAELVALRPADLKQKEGSSIDSAVVDEGKVDTRDSQRRTATAHEKGKGEGARRQGPRQAKQGSL